MNIKLIILAYLNKIPVVLKALKGKEAIVLIPSIITVFKTMSTTQQAGWFLGALMIFDSFTGILVSVKEYPINFPEKKLEFEKLNSFQKFFRAFSSDRWKRSGTKFLLYISAVLAAWTAQTILKIKTFDIPLTDLKFSLALTVILFWISTEVYSIYFENFNKLGFNIKDYALRILKLKKDIQNETN